VTPTVGSDNQEAWTWQYGWIFNLGGVAGLILVHATNAIVHQYADRAIEDAETLQTSVVDHFQDVKDHIDTQVTAATFHCGNIFYEIYFSVIRPTQYWNNIFYFGFSVLSLILGCLSISLGSGISFLMDDLPNTKTKSLFAKHVQPVCALLS
jgi:hypothetical protein